MANKTPHLFGLNSIVLATGITGSIYDYDDGWYEAGIKVPVADRFATGSNLVYDKLTGLTWVDDVTELVSIAGGNAKHWWQPSTLYSVGDLVGTPRVYFYSHPDRYPDWAGWYMLGGTYNGEDYFVRDLGGGMYVYIWYDTMQMYVSQVLGTKGSNYWYEENWVTYPWAHYTDDSMSYYADCRAPLSYICLVGHTSGTGTLEEDIAAHPTYWEQQCFYKWSTASPFSSYSYPPVSLSDMASYCHGLSYGGFTDWRVPNYLEMLSVFDLSYGRLSPPFTYTTSNIIGTGSVQTATLGYNMQFSGMGLAYTWVFPETGVNYSTPYRWFPVRGGLING